MLYWLARGTVLLWQRSLFARSSVTSPVTSNTNHIIWSELVNPLLNRRRKKSNAMSPEKPVLSACIVPDLLDLFNIIFKKRNLFNLLAFLPDFPDPAFENGCFLSHVDTGFPRIFRFSAGDGWRIESPVERISHRIPHGMDLASNPPWNETRGFR